MKNGIAKKPFSKRFVEIIKNYWQLYVLLLLPIAYMFIFHYMPMYGAQIAFRNYNVVDGITGSPWVGLKQFQKFFDSPMFFQLIRNTLSISLYSLIAGAPFPILLAVMLHHLPFKKYGKAVQMITYAPHFISIVVMVSIVNEVLHPKSGILHNLLAVVGIDFSTNFLTMPSAFNDIFVWSGIWQSIGFSSVVYMAILSGVDTTLHEAAMIDGASMWKRIWHIDVPSMLPQFTISLILSLGQVLNVGFEKVLLLKNDFNATTAQVISTYVYEIGVAAPLPDISYTAAIGLFQSLIAFVLIVIVNKVVSKVGGTSLW